MRREQQRLRMVNWRKAKKHKVSDMVHERRQLEKVLRLRVKFARVASDGVSARSTAEAYRQVILESAALTGENLALREVIGEHVKVEALMEREAQTFLTQIRPVPERRAVLLLQPVQQEREFVASVGDTAHVQTGSVRCQALQSFNEDAHVMVGNIPGEVNQRYLVLARHTREKRSDGKRVDKYMLTIADSEANQRNREAEGCRKTCSGSRKEALGWMLKRDARFQGYADHGYHAKCDHLTRENPVLQHTHSRSRRNSGLGVHKFVRRCQDPASPFSESPTPSLHHKKSHHGWPVHFLNGDPSFHFRPKRVRQRLERLRRYAAFENVVCSCYREVVRLDICVTHHHDV
ncbi:hypothetical protein PHYPSEUDO_005327 [Phytophthora pseudosyringae]|uniref:Uncharacterized protein n=1 Tax=Phytophthora pseudosyringae TaxID=221518 RepID=A0A8T1VLQ8_9STRA|nr:hypothetical protein PHYPSEUDO_005327 [Phytophthora pseudosyringae]